MDSQASKIWQLYSDQLLAYINKRVANSQDAEDLRQEVFLKIYNKLDTLDDLVKLESWLYQVTKNTIIDYYRKKKDQPTKDDFFLSLFADDEQDEDVNNMNEQLLRVLGDFIDDVSSKNKEAIQLYYLEHLDHQTISDKLGISVSASKMRVKRGKEELKQALFDCCDFKVDIYGNIVDMERKNSDCSCDCG